MEHNRFPEELVPLDQLDLTDPDEDEEDKPPKFGFMDIAAFTIAAYQIVFPILFALIGVVLLIYLVLRLIAR